MRNILTYESYQDDKNELIQQLIIRNKKTKIIKNLKTISETKDFLKNYLDIFELINTYSYSDGDFILLKLINDDTKKLNEFLDYFYRDSNINVGDFVIIQIYKKYARSEQYTAIYAIIDGRSSKSEHDIWVNINGDNSKFLTMNDHLLYDIKDIIKYNGYFNDHQKNKYEKK